MSELSEGWARGIPPSVLSKVLDLIGADGHTIWKGETFLETGLDPKLVDHFNMVQRSDHSHPKATIFVNGTPSGDLEGVYGLDMLRSISVALGLGWSDKMGRGAAAMEYTAKIKDYIEACGDDQVPTE